MRPAFTAAAALLALVLFAACSGGQQGATPSPAAMAAITPTPSPVPEPTAPESPSPMAATTVTYPVRHVFQSPAKVTVETGILLADPRTGEVVVWELPVPGARPISGDGRWAAWSAPDGRHLLNTSTGEDRVLALDGKPMTVLGFSPGSGEHMAVVVEGRFLLLETATWRVLAEAPVPAGLGPHSAAEFTRDGARVAQAFIQPGPGGASTVLALDVNGTSRELSGAGWPMDWSPDGTRLATTTGTGTVIVEPDGSRSLLPFRGFNPRWSPDGGYLAIANDFDVGGARIFDAGSLVEVLRYRGMPNCIADYWRPDGTLQFGQLRGGNWQSLALSVDGTTRPYDDERHAERRFGYEFVDDGADPATRARTVDGRDFELTIDSMWSAYYDIDGVRWLLNDGRLLRLLGVGGKGLCDGTEGPPSFQLSPFLGDFILPTYSPGTTDGMVCDVRGQLAVQVFSDGKATRTIPSVVSPPQVFGPLQLVWPEGTHIVRTDLGLEVRDWKGGFIARHGTLRLDVRICWDSATAYIVDPGQERR